MSLGIYFGSKIISIVETKGKNIVNNIQIPNTLLSVGGADDKIPEEVKTVAVIKESLRKHKIENKDAVITLSSKDLIIRTFGIPMLPLSELPNAVNFEAKKYIPFKIEDLVSNYQIKLDRASRRYYVLFVGIKKEIMEKYLSIMQQLNIKINSIEYSAFSILRLLELTGVKENGVVGVINIDAIEGDEAAFTVTENGFPLFSCDIKLAGGAQEAIKSLKDDGMASERFKTEIRISLDYYNHKFPSKKIKRVFLIGAADYRASIEPFMLELGLAFKLVDPFKVIGKTMPFSLSFLKAYSSSLFAQVRTFVKVDILLAWERLKHGKLMPDSPLKLAKLLIADLNLNPMIIILALIICSVTYGFGSAKKSPLQQELNAIVLTRPKCASAGAESSPEELQGIEAKYAEKIVTVDKILKKQLYLTPQLGGIADMLPQGMWLEGFSFNTTNGPPFFSLKGVVYMGNNSKELEAINTFLQSLKKDSTFSGYFKSIDLISADTLNIADKTATNFEITGKN